MKILGHALRTWQNLGVTAKFGLAFALLFGMILVEATASLLALGDVRRAEDIILSSVEIRQRVFEMDGQLEKARRLHRDFFLQYPHIGFLAAQELYFKPSTKIISNVVATSEDLKRLIEGSQASNTLRERSNDLTLYLNTARRFSEIFAELVTLVTTLAAPETGLESRLAAVESEVETLAKRSPSTLLLFRQMALQHRQYIVTRQRPFMQLAMNTCEELRKTFGAQSGLSPADREAAKLLLEQHQELARQIPDIDVAIRSKLNDFTLQARSVDPISANLKSLTTQEVERARSRIASASRVSTAIILVTTITGLCFVLLVAAVIHTSVTRKLVALTRSAEEMRAGHLEAIVEVDSRDEVGVLAASFKEMAQRMNQLVCNLENMVQVRTAELTETRDRLVTLVSELDDKNHALEILSVTDRLTGLANRRKLESSLQAELLRARRYDKEFSVIMLDIDRFKIINDTFGHQTGDAVLAQLAAILRDNARETDIVGRWGGEEFLIICPETSLLVVTALAERYRQEMERTDFGPVGQVTSSFGVTAIQEGDNMQTLVRRADEALYRAKESGRNRVESDPLHALH
jgi:diguanylate cyclase (GGDEF)-like protein